MFNIFKKKEKGVFTLKELFDKKDKLINKEDLEMFDMADFILKLTKLEAQLLLSSCIQDLNEIKKSKRED